MDAITENMNPESKPRDKMPADNSHVHPETGCRFRPSRVRRATTAVLRRSHGSAKHRSSLPTLKSRHGLLPDAAFPQISLRFIGRCSLWLDSGSHEPTQGSSNQRAQDVPRLLELIQTGRIDPSFVVTHRMPLRDAAHTYDIFRDKQDGCVKVVLGPAARFAKVARFQCHWLFRTQGVIVRR